MNKGVSSFCVFFPLALAGCGEPPAETVERNEAVSAEENIMAREDSRALTQEYAAFRKSRISNVEYTLSVDLEAASDEFSGHASISFDLSTNNGSPVTIDYDSGEILALSVNGNPGDWQYERWYIVLPAAQFEAGRNTVEISYRRPYATDGAGLHKFTDPENGEVYLYTNFEPYDANRLFPHFDQPNLKAPLTLDVLAPANWQVIANTRETVIEETADGRRHWIFPPTPVMSSYIYALHAGPFVVWEDNSYDIPLRLFARSSLAPYVNTEEWFVPTRQFFDFFQNYFEVDYPFGKYDQVVVPDFNAGAMENIAAVTFNERYISRGEKSVADLRRLAYVIAHEMAHMWFGDLVTMDWWNGLWLNESFATYMGYLALERAGDFENTWDVYYSGNKVPAYRADTLVTTHPIELEVPTTADAFSNFDSITYNKGGSVLKQLPYFIGEENFRIGVSNYLKEHAYGNTSLDDFVGALAEASGMDLDQWKLQWLYQSGTNTIEADYQCENERITVLRLLQSVPTVATADKVLRSQRTQVGLYRYTDSEMVLDSAIPVTYSGEVTDVPEATGKPCPDMVFPNEDDWAFVQVNLDDRSRETLAEHINDFDSPINRLMLWESLWGSIRDINMSLDEFTGFALDNIGPEVDANVITQVSGNLGSAFDYYNRFGEHDEAAAEIEDFFREQLITAEPGSEEQKIWYDGFVSRAHTDKALTWLAELIAGNETIPGLAIDQDKRWGIVIALNRYLHGDYEALLESESARDPSDQGQNSALAAEAIRPLPEVKQRFLDIVIDDPDRYKLAALRTIMANLFPSEQLDLMEASADRILSVIPEINANASEAYLDDFVNLLVPATCTGESVARLAQANEDFAGFSPLVVKAFLIEHQEDERCVAIASAL